jgi:alkylation response protein AidB-like acyl-CoA dehydrogenase
MKPCKPYLYEFLYRGRAPDDDEQPAWHVAIETRLDAGHGNVVPHVRTLGIAQAAKEGWHLSKISEAINFATLAELELARARIVELEAELEAARATPPATSSSTTSAAELDTLDANAAAGIKDPRDEFGGQGSEE